MSELCMFSEIQSHTYICVWLCVIVYVSLCVCVFVCVQGVMISHDNLTWTARLCVELYGVTNVSIIMCVTVFAMQSIWYVCTYVVCALYVCTYICMSVWLCVHMCAYMCTMHVCAFVFVCMYCKLSKNIAWHFFTNTYVWTVTFMLLVCKGHKDVYVMLTWAIRQSFSGTTKLCA